MKTIIQVDKMFCKGCAGHVVDAIHAAYPDAQVDVDLETKRIAVADLSDKTDEILSLIEAAGYPARLASEQ